MEYSNVTQLRVEVSSQSYYQPIFRAYDTIVPIKNKALEIASDVPSRKSFLKIARAHDRSSFSEASIVSGEQKTVP